MYLNYYKKKKKFPEDFTYMSETYNLPKDLNIIKEKFIDYQPTEDNLWLIKPKGSARGEGIEFLKVYNNLRDLVLNIETIFQPEINILQTSTTDKIILTRKQVALIFILGFFEIFESIIKSNNENIRLIRKNN